MYSVEEIDTLFKSEFNGLGMEECFEKVNQLKLVTSFSMRSKEELERSIAQCEEAELVRIELLRRISEEKFPFEAEAACEYTYRLLWRAIPESKEEYEITLQKIQEISEKRFPESVELALVYATGLTYMLDKQERYEQEDTLELLRKISEERFATEERIRECYKSGLAKVHGEVSDQKYEVEIESTTHPEYREALQPRVYDFLQKLYAAYELQLDSDPYANSYFKALYDYYDAFDDQNDIIEFAPIRSNNGKIQVMYPKDKGYYSIIWDSTLWDLYGKFCAALNSLREKNYWVLCLCSDQPVVETLEFMLSEIYAYLKKYFMNTDSRLSAWCGQAAFNHKKKSKIEFPADGGIGKGYFVLGKIYVMHHEFEHILSDMEIESENNESNRNDFQIILSRYKEMIEDSEAEKIHGYTKEEYVDRLNKLIEGEGRWGALQNELFCDVQAFLEMITAQQILADLSAEDAIINAILGAKIYNLFRTLVFIARYYTEKGSYYKDQGFSQIECAKAIFNETHLNEDDVEFRQVVGHLLNIEYLRDMEKRGWFSAQDFRLFDTCADEFIDVYQKSFVAINQVLQQEFISEYIVDVRKE